METKFLLGRVQITQAARLALKRLPYDLVARHAVNEHGRISSSERKRNELSMLTIGPIRSRYRADPTNPKSPYVLVQTNDCWDTTLVSIE